MTTLHVTGLAQSNIEEEGTVGSCAAAMREYWLVWTKKLCTAEGITLCRESRSGLTTATRKKGGLRYRTITEGGWEMSSTAQCSDVQCESLCSYTATDWHRMGNRLVRGTFVNWSVNLKTGRASEKGSTSAQDYVPWALWRETNLPPRLRDFAVDTWGVMNRAPRHEGAVWCASQEEVFHNPSHVVI